MQIGASLPRNGGGKRQPIPDSNDQVQKHSPLVQPAVSGWSAESSEELGTVNEWNAVDSALGKQIQQESYVQTLDGNPGLPTPVIRQAYFICVTQADKTLDITTPYFVPDEDIIMALKDSYPSWCVRKIAGSSASRSSDRGT